MSTRREYLRPLIYHGPIYGKTTLRAVNSFPTSASVQLMSVTPSRGHRQEYGEDVEMQSFALWPVFISSCEETLRPEDSEGRRWCQRKEQGRRREGGRRRAARMLRPGRRPPPPRPPVLLPPPQLFLLHLWC